MPYGNSRAVSRIPAVTGIPTVTSQIQPGMRLLVDGEAGRVTIDPSPSEMERFSKLKRDYERSAVAIAADEMLPCITQDGIEISLLANIGRPEEVEQVGVHNLSGVGLFRTEFLFLESHERPSFQVQLEIYEQAAGALADRPLVIRTFDLGGDKWPAFLSSEHPSRHLRGLRFSLAEGRLFETQLRAIVQVARAKMCGSCSRWLLEATTFPEPPRPSTAWFTNSAWHKGRASERDRNACGPVRLGGDPRGRRFRGDRYQRSDRVHASDRSGCGRFDRRVHSHAPRGAEGDQASHRGRRAKHRPVCVCGEEAGDADFACLLAGLGIRELSMSPVRAAAVREGLRNINCQSARHLPAKPFAAGLLKRSDYSSHDGRGSGSSQQRYVRTE